MLFTEVSAGTVRSALTVRQHHMAPNGFLQAGVLVTHRETGRTIALFRCTQMVLYPKGDEKRAV